MSLKDDLTTLQTAEAEARNRDEERRQLPFDLRDESCYKKRKLGAFQHNLIVEAIDLIPEACWFHPVAECYEKHLRFLDVKRTKQKALQ